MAKSLEEHLYRSALTKEEYMDQSTLRERLQNIAQNLESHQSNNMNSNNQMQNGLQQNDTRQLQELLRSQGGNNNGGGMNQMDNRNNSMGGMMGGNMSNDNMNDRRRSAQQQIDALARNNMGMSQRSSSGESGSGGDPQKVIRQQQQRLLLLRHASKCKLGPECTTRFCAQMKPLWQHMKRCRDKDCQTRHCQSSRCVLTHYRICKSQGKTSTCEICGPVMEHIQRQERADGLDSSDPLEDKNADTNLMQNQQGDMRNMSVFGGQDDIQKNAAAAKRQLQEQVLRQQQQQQQQNQMGNNPQQMLLQLQQMQMRFQQQQIVINKLKNQQQQLSDQQQQLQRNPQNGPQAQNQLRLLQQLEMRAKQQQQLEYQELMMQHKNIQQMQLKIKATQQQQQQNQLAQQLGGMGGQQNQLNFAANQMNPMGMNSMNNNANNQNGSQQLSTSQRSHHSNNSNGSQQGSRQRRRSSVQQQQQPQQQSSMNDMLSQNLQKAMNEPNAAASPSSNKNDDPLVGNLLDDAQSNPLSQLDALDASLDVDDSQEVLELPEELGSLDQALEDSPKKESNDRDEGPKDSQPPPLNEATSGGVDLALNKSSNQPLDDNSERSQGSKSKKRRTLSGAVDKGPRGRGGGKGKRLREIEKINLNSEAEGGASGSLSGVKRSADDISKNKNDPSPDTETSGGAAAANKKGGQPSLPKGDVEQHLLMLNKGLHLTSRTITHKCLPIVQQLIDDPYGWVFRDAVDPVLFGLPDYFEVVKNPMHLLLVKKKLENAVYTDMASFERDVKLVFENAILYNGEESDVGTLAKTMKGVFETEYKKVCEGM